MFYCFFPTVSFCHIGTFSECAVMEVHIVTFVVCALLFFELFHTAVGNSFSYGSPFNHGSIVYTWDQLLALRHTPSLGTVRSEAKELRSRRRGCRSGVKCKERKRRYKPCLPSVIMGNVRSLPNKMEELTALTRLRREYRECSLICFTETWLSELSPDSHVTLDGFQLIRADRNATESSKKKGGGIAVFVNERWCNPGHISVKEQLCTRDLELLAVSMWPYYIPREFSHVIAMTVYSPPPSAVAAAATEQIHTIVSKLQNQHPQFLLLISSDFNHASLSSALPTFTQYVTCHTRDNRTLDLLYANIKDAYTSSPLPPLRRSDHNLVHLVTQPRPSRHRLYSSGE